MKQKQIVIQLIVSVEQHYHILPQRSIRKVLYVVVPSYLQYYIYETFYLINILNPFYVAGDMPLTKFK